MRELRAGGMAVIINSSIPENIGAAVRLVKHMGTIKSTFTGIELDAWSVESASCRELKGWLSDGEIVNTPSLNCPSKWLMPIDGDDFSEQWESDKEKSHA
ncbi:MULTISPECIES: hypothetical protein [Enterobacteriaceae]|uniref:hypothetical protein n=1 Tax=Enterobacteriaceae TaxID=543 RepID=UPI00191B827E|nr:MULTISPECIES: hypothetical protein [Enterobacteriaceae]MCO7360947.1 hypothetical protein [Enterobacter mori]HCM9188132.1 hypothetical protein [Enterobacter hormaechei subsp. xiangfangensis]HDC4293791.1 hypothetical protein [Enterobacter hormaechei]